MQVLLVYPLLIETAQILLHIAPSDEQLEKAIRSLSCVDGVLECHKLAWSWTTLSKHCSLHIRVREDSNEQEILLVAHKLVSPHVENLVISVAKHTIQLLS